MTIKISKTMMTVNGKRAGITIDTGPWVEGVDPNTIKIRPKREYFPASFRAAVSVENKSDSREDYFEADSIVLVPGHPLYSAAKAAA